MAKGNSQNPSTGSVLDFEVQHLDGENLRQDVRCFSLSASIGGEGRGEVSNQLFTGEQRQLRQDSTFLFRAEHES
jgi:hypothetical protein